MIKTIAAVKKELIQTFPANCYNNGCLRADEMRGSFERHWKNDENIQLSDKQRRNINFWIDKIMMG